MFFEEAVWASRPVGPTAKRQHSPDKKYPKDNNWRRQKCSVIFSAPPGAHDRSEGKVIRTMAEAIKGWVYLFAFITGGNYVRKAKLKRRGKGVKISPTVFFKYPEMIQIGDHSFINHLCSVWASPRGPITIGSNVLLGPCASIFSSNHGIARGELIRNQPGQDAPIEIGDDVWLGAHVVVTAGVSIGNGAVVGAGAVVTTDLPPMSISAGVPARVIGYRQ
jgi:acetyltransferase-like isoleucine patch superfamily enzyme